MAILGPPLAVSNLQQVVDWLPFVSLRNTASTMWTQRMRSTSVNCFQVYCQWRSNVAWVRLCYQADKLTQWHSVKERRKPFVFSSRAQMGRCVERSIVETDGQMRSSLRAPAKLKAPSGLEEINSGHRNE